MSQLYITDRGIYGMPLAVTIRYVVVFIIFGSVLQVAGASKYFIEFAKYLAGRFTGGVAQVANISSLAMGSISGSAVANVATTGSITIPTMKEAGYNARFAGAVEAAASTGGQLMPPIMGAAAFIMASFLEMQYYTLILSAFIPALLYYVGVGASIYFNSKKMGMKPDKVKIENPKEVLKGGLLFLIPILVIVVTLIVFKKTPVTAGFLGIIFAFVASYFTRDNKITPKKLIDILYNAGKNTAIVCCPVAVAGIITAMINLTALSAKLTVIMVSLAHGSLVPLLIITALSSIIMGMGVPTAVCYIVLATLIAPSVIDLGIDPLAVHMFVFYFGVLSMITPPVAFASYAASAISDYDPNKVSITAVKLAVSGFLIPFFFVYNPSLLLNGSGGEIVLSLIGHAIIILALSAALAGALIKPLNIVERILLLAATLIFIVMPLDKYVYIASFSIITLVVVYHSIKNYNKRGIDSLT